MERGQILNRSRLAPAVLLSLLAAMDAAQSYAGHGGEDDVPAVSADLVKYFLDMREKMVLIDLRPASAYQKSRLPGARSLPLEELDKRFREIPQSGRVVLYCDCPQNQLIEEAYRLLKDYGYRNAAIMADRFQDWVKRKYPVETGP
ncbi:MAG TPA: rhodanese-like domain-containing protein [Candidatus Acidoferrales bacterium]|nr:rhodanese-like domain-containing protein [Candidatus Acidoferrales bacterium]